VHKQRESARNGLPSDFVNGFEHSRIKNHFTAKVLLDQADQGRKSECQEHPLRHVFKYLDTSEPGGIVTAGAFYRVETPRE